MTLTKKVRIETNALQVISRMAWEQTPSGVIGRIVDGQLDRKLYQDVNKGLDLLGGKWNRKLDGHQFDTDPRPEVEALLGTGSITVERDGFFQTPAAVISQLVQMFDTEIRRPVLEPSAGEGTICDFLVAEYGIDKSELHVIEKNDRRRSLLADKGYTVVGDDFMEFEPDTPYQTIVMNPPFEVQQDVDHITHAFNVCLAEGGDLLSVVSESPFFRDNQKSSDFRNLVSHHGFDQEVPAGAFNESGTGVKTRLIYLRK